MTWSLLSTIGGYFAAQDWVATPATITATKLERHQNDGSTSYKVTAEYRYAYAGSEYTSDRIGLATEFEGDSYDKRKHRELEKLRDSGDTTTCYVNPSDPAEALLDRSLRATVLLFHLPFVICFNLAGLGISGGAIYYALQERRKGAIEKLHKDAPWKARKDWAAGEVKSSNAQSLLGSVVIAVLWNGLCLPIFLVVLLESDEHPWWLPLVVGLFPLVGIGLLYPVAKSALRLLRFGRSTFRMANTPGVVGGELAGVVLGPEALRNAEQVRVRLECLRQVTRRDSDGDTTTTMAPCWEEERIVERTLADKKGQRGVPIRFVIPSSAKETNTGHDSPITWRLSAHARMPGPDFDATFDVPVFITEDSEEHVESTADPLTEYEREESLEEMLGREGVRYECEGPEGALRLACPPARHALTGFILFVVTTGMLGGAIGMAVYMDEWIKWIFVPVFGLLGIVFTGVTFDALLSCCDVEIEGDRWRVRSGPYGFRRAEEFPAADLRSISLKQWMSSSSGNEPAKKWNHVIARLKGGRKLTLVRGLSNRGCEKKLLAELKRRAGLA